MPTAVQPPCINFFSTRVPPYLLGHYCSRLVPGSVDYNIVRLEVDQGWARWHWSFRAFSTLECTYSPLTCMESQPQIRIQDLRSGNKIRVKAARLFADAGWNRFLSRLTEWRDGIQANSRLRWTAPVVTLVVLDCIRAQKATLERYGLDVRLEDRADLLREPLLKRTLIFLRQEVRFPGSVTF